MTFMAFMASPVVLAVYTLYKITSKKSFRNHLRGDEICTCTIENLLANQNVCDCSEYMNEMRRIKPLKIAFGFEDGVGKDVACSYLTQQYGGNHLYFAKPIYDLVRTGFRMADIDYPAVKDRHFLKWYGEHMKEYDENVWVNVMENKINEIERRNIRNNLGFKFNENIFISDLRFKNEYDMLKKHDFICILIRRSNSTAPNSPVDNPLYLGNMGYTINVGGDNANDGETNNSTNNNHVVWDNVIINDSDKSALFAKIDRIIQLYFDKMLTSHNRTIKRASRK
jgi:hypothetical protein